MNQYISALFSGFGISDIFDIILITFVIYTVIAYARSTRAASLVKGVVVLLVAYLVSSWIKLYAFNWLLGQVLNIGLISVVIIFQPELRRALEYIGRGKIVKGQVSMSRARITEFVEQIVSSIGYFAGRKEGALLVFERDTALSDIAETGTIIDARISSEMIGNIFYKGAPLHDGAAIIRGDRILAAGCVLPLTENTNLSKDLGTRHRAGIGMSENSDALVLIVSEETGIISMAMDGKLSRFLDLKTVEKTLLTYYIDREDIKNARFAGLAGIWRTLNETNKNN
ncbi:MAG: TIGR00159 family protein [Firmicutes bacterium]|nr:TIGR00159 family protein [Bacillota bacterium]